MVDPEDHAKTEFCSDPPVRCTVGKSRGSSISGQTEIRRMMLLIGLRSIRTVTIDAVPTAGSLVTMHSNGAAGLRDSRNGVVEEGRNSSSSPCNFPIELNSKW